MKFSSLNYASNAWSRIITRCLVSVSNSNLYLSRCIRNSLSVGEGYTLGGVNPDERMVFKARSDWFPR